MRTNTESLLELKGLQGSGPAHLVSAEPGGKNGFDVVRAFSVEGQLHPRPRWAYVRSKLPTFLNSGHVLSGANSGVFPRNLLSCVCCAAVPGKGSGRRDVTLTRLEGPFSEP